MHTGRPIGFAWGDVTTKSPHAASLDIVVPSLMTVILLRAP